MNFDSIKSLELTMKEAADKYGVHRTTIYRWIQAGYVTPRKIGHTYRFLASQLDEEVKRIGNSEIEYPETKKIAAT